MVTEKSLLLVVDVQNGFMNQETKKIIGPLNGLLDSWRRKKGGKVVFSRFINPEDGPWERFMGWHRLKGEKDTSLHPDLIISGSSTMTKSTYSAWTKDLEKICKDNGIGAVFICGVDTDQCVLATAIDVFEANLEPYIVVDCCASAAGKKFHQAALLLLERLIGKNFLVRSKDLKL